MADWRADVIKAAGGKITPSTLAFLQGWGTKEGGHVHNTARFNWLNRTDKGYPSAGTSQASIVAYPDYQTGVARTAQLIQSGYPAIANSLRQGQVSFQNPALQGDLNRWLTGSRTPGMTPYVSSVAKLAGLPGGETTGGGRPQAQPAAASPSVPQQQARPNMLGAVLPLLAALQTRREQRLQGERPSLGGLVSALQAFRPAEPMPEHAHQDTAAPASIVKASGQPVAPTRGGFMQLPMAGQWSGTHVTDGLGWGSKTAEDLMGSPGTAVGAPEDGTIEYFHPTGAQGGGSMMIRTPSGRQYWLGHIADGLPAGTVVRRGERIASISGDHPRPHVHIDYQG